MRNMLKSKIHRARVTGADIDYEGSIAIDTRLMEAADILPFEQVAILNINNGTRFETYAIKGEKGEICINGAAARLAVKGDTVIILTYQQMEEEQARTYSPKLVHVDSNNDITGIKGSIETTIR
ncbi:MAG: aspartate 1-decarboxylase [Chloroflexi bacterium RBG_13_46_14]|nr:MAG: aspartate 1-decarboxylase [Chloroflexi bacterium RBG_13_46_14]